MPAISLTDIQRLRDAEVEDRLVYDFLELFNEDDPLQREEVEEWKQLHTIPTERIVSVAKDAIKRGWVRDTGAELFITEAGIAAIRG
jgi:hypothetical protein